MSGGSNRLPVLAAEIQKALLWTNVATGIATQAAIKTGKLLAEAKKAVPHGQWLPWLKQNCALSARSAQGYMRLAERFGHLPPEKAQRVAHMSLRNALARLSEKGPEAGMRRHAEAMRKFADEIEECGLVQRAGLARSMATLAEALAEKSETASTVEELRELVECAGKSAELFGEYHRQIVEDRAILEAA
jgi:aspartate aminotransferase-like enzyme